MLTISLVAAVATAGFLGGIHCASMCGGMATMLSSAAKQRHRIIPIIAALTAAADASRVAHSNWQTSALQHAGRIFAYGLMGAVVGLLGAAGLLLKPVMPVHTIMFIIGNLALIWLGLRLVGHAPLNGVLAGLGKRFSTLIPARFSLSAQAGRHPFLTGMAWGCLPCGLLYGVLPFALLSGDALSGALLMMVFGLTALPHLLLAQGAAQWLHQRRVSFAVKSAGALGLIGFGVYGLLHMHAMGTSSLFCITPIR